MNCKYLSWKFSQLNCKNSLTQIFDLLSNSKQDLMQMFCDTWRRNCNLFEIFENQAVQAESNRVWISALHKSLLKGAIKNGFVYVEISSANLLYQLRSKPFTHQRDLDLKYIQDILLFHIAWLLYHYTQCLRS